MSYDALIEQLRAAYDARAARDRAAARRAAGPRCWSRRRRCQQAPQPHASARRPRKPRDAADGLIPRRYVDVKLLREFVGHCNTFIERTATTINSTGTEPASWREDRTWEKVHGAQAALTKEPEALTTADIGAALRLAAAVIDLYDTFHREIHAQSRSRKARHTAARPALRALRTGLLELAQALDSR